MNTSANNNSSLEQFYSEWSNKDNKFFNHDLKSAERKFEVIYPKVKKYLENERGSIIDYGCGFGTFLSCSSKKNLFQNYYGFDYSENAIKYAKSNYNNNRIKFNQLRTLDSLENISFIKEIIKPLSKVNVVALIDLLEHVPDCSILVHELASITQYFLIKLPIENSVFDNYFINKQYPGLAHSNGHVREFTVNNVYYFIRKLGLNPVVEYIYI